MLNTRLSLEQRPRGRRVSRVSTAAAVSMICAALGAICTTASGQAQTSVQEALPADNCRDDKGVDRCDPRIQAEVRARFGAASIEELSSAGIEVRRAFFVDGHGGQGPLIAFERRPGADPRVIVSTLGRERVSEMSAPAPLRIWEDILAGSEHFDRRLAPLPGREGEGYGCLHSWVITVEASDPARGPPGAPPAPSAWEEPTRTRTENACGKGLAVAYALDLARAAYDSLPHCNVLSLDRFGGNALALLGMCASLEGDRMAAAQAMNARIAMDLDEDEAAWFLDFGAQIFWSGEAPVRGGGEVAAFLRRKERDRFYFFVERMVGENADTVRAIGYVYNAQRPGRTARAEQIWTRWGQGFVLQSMRVEAFEEERNESPPR